MRSTTTAVLIVYICISAAAQDASGPAQLLPPVEELVREALTKNPRIDVLLRRIEAMEERIPQAAALPDPVVGFSLLNFPIALNPVDLDREPMTQVQATWAQTFPSSGTRRWREEVARRQVAVGMGQLDAGRLSVAALVRAAVVEQAFAERVLAIAIESRQAYELFVESARTKYRVGTGGLQSVLRAQVELAALDARIVGYRREVTLAKARINVLLDRSYDSPLGSAGMFDLSAPPVDSTTLLRQALERNPAIAVERASIDMSEAEISLSRARLNPDYTLRFAYGYRNDRVDFWTAGVSFNLPFWRGDKQRRAVAEKEAERRAGVARLEVRRNELSLAIGTALISINDARKQLRLYRDAIIPQARQTLEAAVVGYKSDTVDFLSMIEAEKRLFELEIAAARLVFQHEKNIVDIEAATGDIPGY